MTCIRALSKILTILYFSLRRVGWRRIYVYSQMVQSIISLISSEYVYWFLFDMQNIWGDHVLKIEHISFTFLRSIGIPRKWQEA